jgi:TfoX/Sxy family transcriptional regulator of competence genes
MGGRHSTKSVTSRSTTAASPTAPAGVDPRFVPIVAAFSRNRRVTYGKMMASWGLRVNGRIFAMMVKGDLVLKLPKARVEELVRAGRATNFDPGHGRVMKEWAVVADESTPWLDLANEAYAFVSASARCSRGRRRRSGTPSPA